MVNSEYGEKAKGNLKMDAPHIQRRKLMDNKYWIQFSSVNKKFIPTNNLMFIKPPVVG